mgnify:CR=1 FL=1
MLLTCRNLQAFSSWNQQKKKINKTEKITSWEWGELKDNWRKIFEKFSKIVKFLQQQERIE